MTYDHALDAALNRLHDEGRYRTFIDIERQRGHYPNAVWTRPDGTRKDITVWCGNDYLGMGQHPAVLSAMHEALDATGAGSGGTRNISGTTVYHKRLEAELADLHGKEAALVFTSAYVANDATLSTLPSTTPESLLQLEIELSEALQQATRTNARALFVFAEAHRNALRALEPFVLRRAWKWRRERIAHEGEFELWLTSLAHALGLRETPDLGLLVLAGLRPAWVRFHARKARLKASTMRSAGSAPPAFVPGILRWMDALSELDQDETPLPRFERRGHHGTWQLQRK